MFSKVAKGQREAEVQGEAAKHSFAPRIHRVDGDVVHMDSIKGACLADTTSTRTMQRACRRGSGRRYTGF